MLLALANWQLDTEGSKDARLRWLPRDFTKVAIRTGMGYKRNSSSLVLLSLFLRYTSKVTKIITLATEHLKKDMFSSILTLFFNI